jgi:hypothetical protein
MRAKKKSRAGKVFPDPTAALIRARKTAEDIARRTGTAVVVERGGKLVRIRPKSRKQA